MGKVNKKLPRYSVKKRIRDSISVKPIHHEHTEEEVPRDERMVARDSLEPKRKIEQPVVAEAKDEDETQALPEIIPELGPMHSKTSSDKEVPTTTKIRFQDEIKHSKKLSVVEVSENIPMARSSRMEATSLNVDLLETVVKIIDYTNIPELPPLRRRDRSSIKKKKYLFKERRRSPHELTEDIDFGYDEVEPEEFDGEIKKYKATKSVEMDILGGSRWSSRETDDEAMMKKAQTVTVIGDIEHLERRAPAEVVRRSSENLNVITFQEEDMHCRILEWVTRDEYKATIGINFFTRLLKYLRVLLERGALTDPDPRFTKFQFAVMLLLHEFNLSQITMLGENLLQYGTAATMIAHTFILFFIEMPFLLKMMTMASFSQRYILQFFRAVPLLKGIGYCSLILFVLILADVGLMFEGAFRVLLFLLTTTSDWRDCPLKAEEYKCIPFHGTSSVAKTCTRDDEPGEFFSTQYFINHIVFNPDNANVPWYIKHGGIVIWGIVLLIALNGISLTKKVTVQVQFGLFFVPLTMWTTILGYRVYSVYRGDVVKQYTYTPWTKILTAQFLIDALTVATKIHQLPYLIWVCAMKPKKANTEVYTSMVIFACILLSWASACIFISCVEVICQNNDLNPKCLFLYPYDHVFTLVPDLILHISFAKTWLFLWYFAVLYFSAIYVVYSINVTVDTINQCVPMMTKGTLIFSIAVWAFIFLCRYLRMSEDLHKIFAYFQPSNMTPLYAIMFGMLVFGLQFFYGQGRFRDDFMFYNNTAPKRIWVVCWHIIVYIGIVALICGLVMECIHATNVELLDRSVNAQIELIAAFLVFVIVLAFFLRRSCYWLYIKRSQESFNPDLLWGALDPKIRLLRKYYFSTRDVRVRRKRVICKHVCLLSNTKFKHAQYTQMIKVNRMREIMERVRKQKKKTPKRKVSV